jgi:hypothetical protein
MGVYIYTLRKGIHKARAYDGNAEDIEFGTFQFGFRDDPRQSWMLPGDDRYNGAYHRMTAHMDSMAKKAQAALAEAGIQYVVEGDPHKHFKNCDDPLAVYKWRGNPSYADVVPPSDEQVGELTKIAGKYYFKRIKVLTKTE